MAGNEFNFGFQKFGRRVGHIPHLLETTKQYQRRGYFGHFWLEEGIQGGKIMGDNSAGHCFVFWDFDPTNKS